MDSPLVARCYRFRTSFARRTLFGCILCNEAPPCGHLRFQENLILNSVCDLEETRLNMKLAVFISEKEFLEFFSSRNENIFVLLVLAATLIMSVRAAGEPDCAALANENPLKINTYYHPHESDCNQYYQCSRYLLVPMACPEGLHFDRNAHICGRPREVTC